MTTGTSTVQGTGGELRVSPTLQQPFREIYELLERMKVRRGTSNRWPWRLPFFVGAVRGCGLDRAVLHRRDDAFFFIMGCPLRTTLKQKGRSMADPRVERSRKLKI